MPTIEPSDLFEQALVRLLLAAHKYRLRAIVEAAPGEVMSASERIADQRATLWLSEN
jgi:hypothetical protein